jgi:hypothetical protein
VNLRHWTIGICIVVPVLLAIYDAACAATPAEDSITQIVRRMNRWSDGLIALGTLAVWWHCFAPMPNAWIWK